MIKEQIIQYRNQNSSYRILLGTVLGELDRISKDPSDEQVIQIVKKMIEANNLVNSSKSKEENFILSQFLPSQLTEEQIESIIKREKFNSIKDCMSFFKELHKGCYDGRLVSNIYNLSKD